MPGSVEIDDLTHLIETGRSDEAVRLVIASSASARGVVSSFGEDGKSEHSAAFVAFARKWHDAAAVEDKLTIARWVCADAVLAFADVDDVRHIAATLLVDTAQHATAFLSALTDDAWVLADGPDAGISDDAAAEITRAGKALRATRWPRL